MSDNIGGRISELIKALGIKKVRFAERIQVDQSYVTQLTKGRNLPSDRLISTICREFDVREEWLRNGTGEMFLEKKADVSLEDLIKGDGVSSDDRALVKSFLELSEPSRNAVIEFVQKCAVALGAPDPAGTSPVGDVASELAELRRQNREIMAQNRELLARLEAIEKEEAEAESLTRPRSR